MDYISINGNMQSQYMFSNAELMRQPIRRSAISAALPARQFISNKTDLVWVSCDAKLYQYLQLKDQRRLISKLQNHRIFFLNELFFFPNNEIILISGEGSDSSLVVSMELNGLTYQGILFQKPTS